MEQKRLQREVDDLEAQVRKLQSAAEDEESRDLHSKEFARLRVRRGRVCWVRHVGSDTSGVRHNLGNAFVAGWMGVDHANCASSFAANKQTANLSR